MAWRRAVAAPSSTPSTFTISTGTPVEPVLQEVGDAGAVEGLVAPVQLVELGPQRGVGVLQVLQVLLGPVQVLLGLVDERLLDHGRAGHDADGQGQEHGHQRDDVVADVDHCADRRAQAGATGSCSHSCTGRLSSSTAPEADDHGHHEQHDVDGADVGR